MVRTCSTCGVEKPITAFHKNGKDKDGNTAYRPDCKECYTITRKVSKKKHSKFTSNTKHRTGEQDTISIKDWKDAMLHFNGCCGYCGRKQSRRIKITKEHVVPVSKGGLTIRSNVIPACSTCNCSKGDREMEDWFKRQKFYRPEQLALIRRWTH